MRSLYEISRKKYNRPLAAAKQAVTKEQKAAMAKVENFSEPIL